MRSIIILALNAALVHSKVRYTPFTTVANWWVTYPEYWPLPDYLVRANDNPDGTVAGPVGKNLPYRVRVNVTELAVPKAVDPDKNKLDNPHIVATTFDVTYTGKPPPLNLSYVAIDGNSSRIRALETIGYDYNFDQDVLDAYDPKKPGDCTGPLGSACVKALESRDLVSGSFKGLNVYAPACEDVLGGLADDDVLFTAQSFVNPTYVNGTNEPFLWHSSGAFVGRDQVALDNELGKMQLIGITAVEQDNESGKESRTTSALCFRVDVNAPTGNDGVRVVPRFGVVLGFALLVAASIIL